MDLGQLVSTYGPYGAAVIILLWVIYRDRERERTRADDRERELKSELKEERSLNDQLAVGATGAVELVKSLANEVSEQRPLQNELLRQTNDIARQVTDINRRLDRGDRPERLEGQR